MFSLKYLNPYTGSPVNRILRSPEAIFQHLSSYHCPIAFYVEYRERSDKEYEFDSYCYIKPEFDYDYQPFVIYLDSDFMEYLYTKEYEESYFEAWHIKEV